MDKSHNSRSNIAFVLGNGRSRLPIDVNILKQYGTVYGCNAVYREAEPDYLIAVDVKMINEIIESGYNTTHAVWTNPNKGINSKASLNFLNPHKGWSSGPTALWLAAQHGYKSIYILGFDFQGISGKFNNVYADTFNYKKSSDIATFHGNWLSQTDKVIKEYKSTDFYRVVEPTSLLPEQLTEKHHTNLKHIHVSEFSDKYPTQMS